MSGSLICSRVLIPVRQLFIRDQKTKIDGKLRVSMLLFSAIK